MKQIHNRKELLSFRKDLRNNLTPAEAKLWNSLKSSKLGKKFRRQHSVGQYIIDFYCPAERLAVELDGADHFSDAEIEHDKIRDAYLQTLNIRVLRFENYLVFEDLNRVLQKITSAFIN